MEEGRDEWWRDLVAEGATTWAVPLEPIDSEDLLYLLYTSGTTAKPEGHRPHDRPATWSGATSTHYYIFDAKPDSVVYWCAADVGWVTGHTLHRLQPAVPNGRPACSVPRASPDYPDRDRWWAIVEHYGVDHPLHGADRDPEPHEVEEKPKGRGRSATSRRSASLARSASRSTRKHWVWCRD